MPESEVKLKLRQLVRECFDDEGMVKDLMFEIDGMTEEEAEKALGEHKEIQKSSSDFAKFQSEVAILDEALKEGTVSVDASLSKLEKTVDRALDEFYDVPESIRIFAENVRRAPVVRKNLVEIDDMSISTVKVCLAILFNELDYSADVATAFITNIPKKSALYILDRESILTIPELRKMIDVLIAEQDSRSKAKK